MELIGRSIVLAQPLIHRRHRDPGDRLTRIEAERSQPGVQRLLRQRRIVGHLILLPERVGETGVTE